MTKQSDFEAEQVERQKRVDDFEAFMVQALSKGTTVLPDGQQPTTEPPINTDEGA